MLMHHNKNNKYNKTWSGTFHGSISPNDCRHSIENDGRRVVFHMTKYIDVMPCVGNDNINKW
jgi:hypothetical protein